MTECPPSPAQATGPTREGTRWAAGWRAARDAVSVGRMRQTARRAPPGLIGYGKQHTNSGLPAGAVLRCGVAGA